MRERPPRLRPLLIVLVPAILLAVLAGRAVLEETRAEESRARRRGQEAATRLARSVRSIVAEYTASMTEAPGDGTERPGFLRPAFLYDAALASAEPEDIARYQPSAEAGAFVGDALDAADSLGDDAAGLEAAAILLRALAAAAPSPAAAEPLRFAASVRDPQLAVAAGRRRLEGFEEIVRNAPGLPESVRVRLVEDVDAILGDRVPGQVREQSRRWEGLRDAARRAAAEGRAVVAMAPRPGGVALVLAAPAGPGRVAGGEVPAETLRERLAAESEALSAEAGFVSVHLIAPGGQRAFGASEAATGDVLVEAVPLDAPLDEWRAEAVLTRPRGVPGSALLLAAAFIGAAATLAWGVFLLHRAAERQARLAAERQSFLDHVAHEVRTPSAALLALGEELAGGHVPPERRGVYEGHIVTEARRLARLVDDTLDLSRLDAGRLVFERAPSDLRIIARNGVEAAAATARTKLDLADAPVVAVADPAALARVVRNLVDNAIRHGGSSTPVVVRVAAEGGDAVVSVADRGSGIDAAVRARLFERFHRKTGETHETKGVGIGLALCREIVEAHGGTISVEETAPGARDPGTTFTLRFPAHAVPAQHGGRP